MRKINFTVEIPDEYLHDLEDAVYEYAADCGGRCLDYHIFYDDSWLKENDPYYVKLISERAKMSRHISEYRNKSDK